MLTEMTNEAYQLVNPTGSISIVANLYFNIFFTIFMAIVVTIVTERMIEPRLGKFVPDPADGAAAAQEEEQVDEVAEARGLRHALYWFLGALAFILLITLPPGAPLRRPTGELDVSSPLLDSLIFIITLLFLFAGIGYGRGAGTIKSSNDVIAGVTKTFAGLASLIFLLLVISQFIGLFNYSNMPQVLGVSLAGILEQANIGAIPLLVGMILVIFLLDFIIPGSHAQMGDLCAGLRATVRPTRRVATDSAGRLPCRRLARQRDHAIDGLLPFHRDGRAAL